MIIPPLEFLNGAENLLEVNHFDSASSFFDSASNLCLSLVSFLSHSTSDKLPSVFLISSSILLYSLQVPCWESADCFFGQRPDPLCRTLSLVNNSIGQNARQGSVSIGFGSVPTA
ncbi:hypothetical protein Mapa_006157 [Marchantia paleacea]|nr:hypothetical protein Mapa_006157 [Marchantia paleacea]